jgi:hypothetical protein
VGVDGQHHARLLHRTLRLARARRANGSAVQLPTAHAVFRAAGADSR